MFEELGLNVAAQPDNAANPRPDNRSGWMAGETPDVVEQLLDGTEQDRATPTVQVRLWDPSTQLRYLARRKAPPRPDGAPNRRPAASPERAPVG